MYFCAAVALYVPVPCLTWPERDLLVQSLALSLPVFMLALRYCPLPERGIIACIRLFYVFYGKNRGILAPNGCFANY